MLVLMLDDVKAFLMDKSFMLLGGLFGQLCDLSRLPRFFHCCTGWLTDETSYTVAFSVGGSIIILSGLILFPSYIIGVCRRHRSGRRDHEGGADVVTWQDAGCGKPLVKEIMVGTPNAV